MRDCEGSGGICWRDTFVKEPILFMATASGLEGWWDTFLGVWQPACCTRVCYIVLKAEIHFIFMQLFSQQQLNKLDLDVWLLGFCVF